MEFTPEFIAEQKFTPEQVIAINGVVDPHIATEKKAWDGLALTNAEKIIDGAITATQKANNHILAREKGEQLGEWQARYSTSLNATSLAELAESKKTYDEKVTNFKGDADLKAKIIVQDEQLDTLLKSKADYDKLNDSGVQGKYDALLIKNAADSKALAYGSIKPAFHKDVDSRIVDHEWNKFVSEIDSKYELVQINGEWVACDKENPKHSQTPLKDLIKANEDLTKLIDGRQQDPLDGNQADATVIEGVPFGVPKDVSNKDLTVLIHKQLTKEGLEKTGHTAAEYSKRFRELNERARGQKTAE